MERAIPLGENRLDSILRAFDLDRQRLIPKPLCDVAVGMYQRHGPKAGELPLTDGVAKLAPSIVQPSDKGKQFAHVELFYLACALGLIDAILRRDPAAMECKPYVTVLTASGAEQYATEQDGAGLFTTLLVDALGGAAADLLGRVTPGAVYAHIDQSLGAWEQRPVFKTNVNRFVSLRQVFAPVELTELRRIADLFPRPLSTRPNI